VLDNSPRQISDQMGRALGVLRLSLTARCNLACPYCLPDGAEPPGLLSHGQRLTLIEAAVGLGVRSLRLTGGEPLLHPNLETLVASVQSLRSRGLRDIALTTNGSLLNAERARSLKNAGLDRLTLSLDGVSGPVLARMAGLSGGPVAGSQLLRTVLDAIEHARAAGFDPRRGELKLNAVIQRGVNDDQIVPLASLARDRGLELRLIEYMDVGSRNGWSPDAVLPAAVMVERIHRHWPLVPLGRPAQGTASRWHYRDGGGAVAVVASVSNPFCGDCNRLRVTADGIAYTCLFASPGSGLDLRPWLQPGSSVGALQDALIDRWRWRQDRYSQQRQSTAVGSVPAARAEMAYLGG
jgi:GTP 3',8-cyclase